MRRSAIISDDGSFRYELRRQWAESPLLGWVMCNPSTADANVDDPTIRRCMRFADQWGYGGIVVRNVYAFRATNPRNLHAASDKWGPDNGPHLRLAGDEPLTICAWGNNVPRNEGDITQQMLAAAGATLAHLGLNSNGNPKHPLYLAADTAPVMWPTIRHDKRQAGAR